MRKWLYTLVALALVVIVYKMPRPMSHKEKIIVTELTRKMDTYCVGRYLIDVPSGSRVFGRATINEVEFEATPMSESDYRRNLADYEATLKTTKSYVGYQYLYVDQEGPEPGTRLIVRLDSPEAPGDAGRVIEAYKWNSGFQIKLQTTAWDWTHSKDRDYPGLDALSNKNTVPEKTTQILGMLARVKGRPASEIPQAPGVCFLGGFLPGKAGDAEIISAQFVPPGHDDVSFDLQTDTTIQEDTTLLERSRSIGAMLSNISGRTIRRGTVSLPGIEAEEWLASLTTPLNVPGHHMTLEANSKTGSPASPLITLDMDTGTTNHVLNDKIDKASLGEGGAIALWDAVSRTLRPRPNGF